MNEQNKQTAVYRDTEWKPFLKNGLISFGTIVGLQLIVLYFEIPSLWVGMVGSIALPPFIFAFWRHVQKQEEVVAAVDAVTLFFGIMWLVLVVSTVGNLLGF